jgi:hypothetical protein
MKQVAHIRQISLTLRERYGEPKRSWARDLHLPPERIAKLTEEELRVCVGLSRQKPIGDRAPDRKRRGKPRVEQVAGRRFAGAPLPSCRAPREGGELRVRFFWWLRAFPIDV